MLFIYLLLLLLFSLFFSLFIYVIYFIYLFTYLFYIFFLGGGEDGCVLGVDSIFLFVLPPLLPVKAYCVMVCIETYFDLLLNIGIS